MIKVLDKGFIELIDSMGDDSRVVHNARVSYGDGTKIVRNEEGLIKYLMKNDHSTPFEGVVLQFHIKCPLFVAAQWRTYRWGSFNQLSARYSVMEYDMYVPTGDRIREQSLKNRQASGDPLPETKQDMVEHLIRNAHDHAYRTYETMLDMGLAREVARGVLPADLYTRFYWTVNLWNLFHFIHQRNADDAQWEIQQYAKAIEELIEPIAPISFAAFKEKYGTINSR